ncbi:MAG: TonB-dependent receptor [Paludibacteraceae bacterium]|nr:TonB-dependent receptor [Paludibacteraceae bacterium]
MDDNNRGIELANVQVKGTNQGTSTSEQGFYELRIEATDTFSVVYSCIGYETSEYKFAAKEDVINATKVLQTLSTEIEGIEIRAFQRQTNTMQGLDTDKFRMIPDASGGNIESMLSSFAGVNSNNELSSQYSVRGGSYDENSVYVNNIEVYRPLLVRAGQQEGLSFINPDLVGNVQFSAGGFSAKYSDKMSSVLDVKYKMPERLEGSVAVSLLGASAYIGSASKNFTQVHGIRYKTSSYLLGTLDTQGEYSPSFVDYQTYLTFKFSEKWSGSFLGNFSQNLYRFIPKERETSFGTLQMNRSFKVYFEGMEKDIFRTYFGAFTVNYEPLKNLKLSLMTSTYNTNEQETYDITGQYWLSDLDVNNTGKTNNQGVGTYHEHARNRLSATVINLSHIAELKFSNHHMQWGVGVQKEIILDRIREWEFRDSAGYSLPYNPEKVELIYNLSAKTDLNTTRFTAYFEETYKIPSENGLWTINGGVRANYWSFNKEWLISPRLSASYFPDWDLDVNLRMAVGLYHQAPFYKEIRTEETDENGNTTMILNQNIQAQRSLHLLFGADYFFRLWNRPFKFTVEGYYKPGDRINPYYVDNVRIRYLGENNAKAQTAGIDLKLFGEFVPGTDSWISFSWMYSKEDILNDSYDVYSNTGNLLGTVYPGYISRPNEQRYNVSVFFQDYFPNHPEYKVHLKLVWSDGLPFGPPHSERYQAVLRTKAYNRVDIGASRGFIKGREKFMSKQNVVKAFWLNLELFNLFNIKNVNSYYWVTDIYNQQFAVPNYLTGFTVNFKISVDF